MESLTFLVQASSSEPYEVIFKKNGDNLTAICDCPVGSNGQYCQHRFNIMNGSTTGVVSGNVADVEVASSWLTGTDVEQAMTEVQEAEKVLDAAKKNLSALKKKLARSMRD